MEDLRAGSAYRSLPRGPRTASSILAYCGEARTALFRKYGYRVTQGITEVPMPKARFLYWAGILRRIQPTIGLPAAL
jgi:hypothetical protein